MATLREYYEKDQGRSLLINKDLKLYDQHGKLIQKVPTRLHLDFESNSLYIALYISNPIDFFLSVKEILKSIDDILAWRNNISIELGTVAEERMKITDLVFTRRVFIYAEGIISPNDKKNISKFSIEQDLKGIIGIRNMQMKEINLKYHLDSFLTTQETRKKLPNLLRFNYRNYCAPCGMTNTHLKLETVSAIK